MDSKLTLLGMIVGLIAGGRGVSLSFQRAVQAGIGRSCVDGSGDGFVDRGVIDLHATFPPRRATRVNPLVALRCE